MDDEEQQRQVQDTARLFSDLLPSPPASEASSSARRSSPRRPSTSSPQQTSMSSQQQQRQRRSGPVTVQDLKHRVCWICQEGDDDDGSNSSGESSSNSSSSGGTRARWENAESTERAKSKTVKKRQAKRFIHPCKCTLVAHESCLLSWIVRKATPSQPIVRCPQCGHPYKILNPKSIWLQFFEFWDKETHRLVPFGASVVCAGMVAGVATTYGYAATRVWFGKGASRFLLKRNLWQNILDVGWIPFWTVSQSFPAANVCNQFVEAVWIVPAITSIAPFDSVTQLLLSLGVWTSGHLFYPPTPIGSIILLPWIRYAYRKLKWHVTRRVLRPFVKRNRRPTEGSSTSPASSSGQNDRQRQQQQQEREPGTQRANAAAVAQRRRTRVIVVGGEENHLVDADAETDGPIPAGAEAVVDGPPPDDLIDDADEVDGDRNDGGGDNDEDEDDEDEHHRIIDEDELEAEGQGGPRAGGGTFFGGRNQGRRGDGEGGQGGGVIDRTIYVTPRSLARMILGDLAAPFIAAGIGATLQWVAERWMKQGNWLQRLLGILPVSSDAQNNPVARSLNREADIWRGLGYAVPPFSSGLRSSSRFANLTGFDAERLNKLYYKANVSPSPLYSNYTLPPSDGPSTNASDAFSSSSSSSDAGHLSLAPHNHWRNTVSLFLYIVVSDAASLAYRYARLKQRTRMTVEDRPFEGDSLVQGLELR